MNLKCLCHIISNIYDHAADKIQVSCTARRQISEVSKVQDHTGIFPLAPTISLCAGSTESIFDLAVASHQERATRGHSGAAKKTNKQELLFRPCDAARENWILETWHHWPAGRILL